MCWLEIYLLCETIRMALCSRQLQHQQHQQILSDQTNKQIQLKTGSTWRN